LYQYYFNKILYIFCIYIGIFEYYKFMMIDYLLHNIL